MYKQCFFQKINRFSFRCEQSVDVVLRRNVRTCSLWLIVPNTKAILNGKRLPIRNVGTYLDEVATNITVGPGGPCFSYSSNQSENNSNAVTPFRASMWATPDNFDIIQISKHNYIDNKCQLGM